MRIIASAVFASLISQSSAFTCQSLCDGLAECAEDPHAHGSYCKAWNNPQVCFGLYFTDASQTEMCFQPNNEGCPEDIPVPCPEHVEPVCENICASLDSCVNDPHGHGSYCKDWQDPQVCFGLYHTDASRTAYCFQPNEEGCPEEFPVAC